MSDNFFDSDFENRIVSSSLTSDDKETAEEISLRPTTFDDYIGQEKVKDNLKIFIEAAKLKTGTVYVAAIDIYFLRLFRAVDNFQLVFLYNPVKRN